MNVKVDRVKLIKILEAELTKLPADQAAGEPEIDKEKYSAALDNWYQTTIKSLDDNYNEFKKMSKETFIENVRNHNFNLFILPVHLPQLRNYYKTPPVDYSVINARVNLRNKIQQEINMLKLSSQKDISINDKSYEWQFLSELSLDDHDILEVDEKPKSRQKRDTKQPEVELK